MTRRRIGSALLAFAAGAALGVVLGVAAYLVAVARGLDHRTNREITCR
jgi:ABC-type nitrate/sulfonate/bicarbonate transport system permease component